MPILTAASTKGGVGKTTIAVNAAIELSRQGVSVALLDGDPQGSVSKWNLVREAARLEGEKLDSIFVANAQGESLLQLALEKSRQGEWVIIDSAGVDHVSSRNALLRTDYILTLAAPSPLDLWEVDTLIKLARNLGQVQNRRIPTLLLFNKVSPNPSVKGVAEAVEFLNEAMIYPDFIFETCVKDRIVYQHSIREGKGVAEFTPINADARQEIAGVCRELLSFHRQHSAKAQQPSVQS